MKKFFNTEKIIKKILEELPITRENDNLLFIRYWQRIVPNVSFIDFFLNPNKYNAATFKRVERCRRKIQEKFPNLRENKAVEKRFEAETKFKEYGLGWNV